MADEEQTPVAAQSSGDGGGSGYEAAAETQPDNAGGAPAPAAGEAPAAAPAPGQPNQPNQQIVDGKATAAMTPPSGDGKIEGMPGAAKPDTPAPAPPVIQPLKPSGLRGLMQSMADMLAGTTRPELAKDQYGNTYVKDAALTPGQQWRKIAGQAITGAAAGLAAGKGAGNMVKAPLAGVQSAQEDQQHQDQQRAQLQDTADKQNLQNANNLKLQMDLAEKGWDMKQKGVQATRQMVEAAEKEDDRLQAHGYQILGIAPHVGDLSQVLHADPNLMENLIKNHVIQIRNAYDENGNIVGVRAFKAPQDTQMKLLPAGAAFNRYNPVSGKIEEQHASDPMTVGQQNIYNSQAESEAMDDQQKKATLAKAQAETNKTNAETSVVPSTIRKNNAEAGKAGAEAGKAAVETKVAQQNLDDAGDPKLVDAIGSGRIAPERMSQLLSRNPKLAETVAAKYPDFDSSKAASYPRVYADFTSTKKGTAGGSIIAAGTALKHLQELDELNTVKSHIPGTTDYTKYMNKADTVAGELGAFYGNTTVPGLAEMKSTLASTLPGNRHGAIQTQAKSMGDRMDEYEQAWKKAAPSSVYEAKMPNMSGEAQEARAKLDPNYRQRVVSAQAADAAPAGATQVWHDPKSGAVLGYTVNGSYQAAGK